MMNGNKILILCRIYRYILTVILFLPFMPRPDLTGQTISGIPDMLTQKLSEYCETVPWEDLFLHTDRNEYIAGEELWFNAYLIDRQKNSLSGISKIAYVEILNAVNKPVGQKRIIIRNGSGEGLFTLSDSLSTGKYMIRAYTNYMKNFLPESCFMKEIYIYNVLKNKTLNDHVYQSEEFATEQGTDNSGVSSPGDIYLTVNNLRSDSLELTISMTDNYRIRNNGISYLFIQTRGNPDRVSQFRFSTNKARISVPKNNLASGINHITIFNSTGLPVSEKYIYTPDKEGKIVSLKSPESVSKREKFTIEIDLNINDTINPALANLSVAVSPATDRSYNQTFTEYLVFGSEFGYLPGLIRNKRLKDIPPEVLDSCLATIESKWLDWKKILSETRSELKYIVEDEYHYMSGTLEYNSQPADSGKYVILSKPGENATFQYATTGSNGNFIFMIPTGQSVEDLIIQPMEIEGNPEIQLGSPFTEEYLRSSGNGKPSSMTIPSYISDWGRNYQVGKIYGSVHYNLPPDTSISANNQKRFYGKPDIELIMDDYIKLPVMQEVFFELVPGVFLKNRRSRYEITMADPLTNIVNDEPPVLMIDGVLVDNAGLIANLEPELVGKIDVVNQRYVVGDFVFSGIVNVITRSADLSSIDLPRHTVRLSYKATEPAGTFSAPEYSSSEMKQNRIPDFRNTLYWNPSVKPDKEGRAKVEFWSSDVSSDYVIDIQGITSDGTKISLQKSITVR